jgi:SAM-dependent methyltransferase
MSDRTSGPADGRQPPRSAGLPLGNDQKIGVSTLSAVTSNRRPSWAPVKIDLDVPAVSRVYDWLLGGSHNFEVDRQAGRAAVEAHPGVRAIAQANRAVLRRAVEFCIGQGVTQFLDIGSGIPTVGNVHEVAQDANPDARVVYVDNDPVAVAHSTAVLEGNPQAASVLADLRDPEDLLGRPEVQQLIDFRRPVALMLVAIIHFLDDDDRPAEIIAALRDALAPGSIMVITHATEGPAPWHQRAVQAVYDRTPTPLVLRGAEQLKPLFDGFGIVEPGIVELPYWHPGEALDDVDQAALHGLVGVGVKQR